MIKSKKNLGGKIFSVKILFFTLRKFFSDFFLFSQKSKKNLWNRSYCVDITLCLITFILFIYISYLTFLARGTIAIRAFYVLIFSYFVYEDNYQYSWAEKSSGLPGKINFWPFSYLLGTLRFGSKICNFMIFFQKNSRKSRDPARQLFYRFICRTVWQFICLTIQKICCTFTWNLFIGFVRNFIELLSVSVGAKILLIGLRG